jgi:hypothetical protein
MAQVIIAAAIYAYIGGAWVQLDDVQPWSASWGIPDNGPLDFVADTGEFKFSLNNSGGLYSPGGPSALAGFKRGIPVKRVVTFEGEDYVRFFGYIDEISIRPSITDKTVTVTALDWMDYAARHRIINPGVLANTYSHELMTILLAETEIKPQQLALTPGVHYFPTVLDTIRTRTTAYSEFTKIALGDIEYIYLRKDKTTGETLTLENYNTRHGWVTPGEIPLGAADSGFLLKEDGDRLLLESGDGILLNETAALTFDGSIIEAYEAPYGDRVINRVETKGFPRRLDASVQVLFQLDEPIAIATGRTYILEGTWADPAGGGAINAQDHVTPVATTDYLANTAEDGSGSNITSDLEITVWRPGTDGFVAAIKNNNAALMYVTRFHPRAIGIYEYNPIMRAIRDGDSVAEHEVQMLGFNQKYRRTPQTIAIEYAESIVAEYAQPRIHLRSITFCANKSASRMMAYLHTDVGDLRQIDIDELGIDSNYYIQGVTDRYEGGLIWVTWTVKEHPSILGGLTPVAIEFTSANNDAIDFGPLFRVSTNATSKAITERTFAAWINPDLIDGTRAIIAPIADTGGVIMYISEDGLSDGDLWFQSNRFISGNGTWHSDTTPITAGDWFHVIVTYDHTSTANDPIMYINGVAQTVIEDGTPAGALNSEQGTHVVVGNSKTITHDYDEGFDGKIFDARIYDRIITAAEALALYNGGDPDPTLVTDGLVFQAFAVRTSDAATLTDTAMEEGQRIIENAYRQVGEANGSPIIRAAP